MAKSTMSLHMLSFVLLLLCSTSGGMVKLADGQVTWCVAKPSSDDPTLKNSIDFACNWLRNCTLIQYGGGCFLPEALISQASVAMNLYYQANNRKPSACYFSNSGLISQTDPSYGSCKYATE